MRKGMALAGDVEDVFTHTHRASPPWLCFRGCLLLSLPQSIRWTWVHRQKSRTSALFGALGGGHLSCSAFAVVLASIPFPAGHVGTLVCCKLLAAHERLGTPFSLLYLHITLHQSHVCQFSCNWALVLCMGSFPFWFSFPETDPFELWKPDDLQSIVCETIRSAVRRFRFSASKRRLMCWNTEVSLTWAYFLIEEWSGRKGIQSTWRAVNTVSILFT